MALTKDGIKAVIKAKKIEVNGTPDDDAVLDNSCEGLARALFQILTSDAIIELNNGADSNGDSLIDKTGKIK